MKKSQYTKHGFNIYFLYKFLHKFPYLVALLMEAQNLGRIQDLVMGGSDKCMPTLIVLKSFFQQEKVWSKYLPLFHLVHPNHP